MRDFYINTGYEHRSEQERIKVPGIEKDKRSKDDLASTRDLKHAPLSQVGTLMSFVKTRFSYLLNAEVNRETVAPFDASIKYFERFRNQFFLLQIQDYSQSIEFATQLSKCWHDILDYFIPSYVDRMKSAKAKELIKEILSQIRSHPKAEDHPLGYYLTHYAGENWLPFPFMKIIRDLHDEHAEDPSHSTITKWITLMNQIVEELSPIKKEEKK